MFTHFFNPVVQIPGTIIVIANAIIDRLVHHCDIVKITGHSYRIKGRNIFDDSDD